MPLNIVMFGTSNLPKTQQKRVRNRTKDLLSHLYLDFQSIYMFNAINFMVLLLN